MSASRRQTVVGLGLALLIIGVWSGVHIWAIFFHRWSGRGWAAALPVVALQTWLGAGMFIIAHDAIHGSLAPGRRRVNLAFGQIAVGLYASFSLRKLARAHMDHHGAPGTAADPDFHTEATASFLPWFVGFFRHYFGWTELARITVLVLVYTIVFRVSPIVVAVFWGVPSILSALQLFTFGTYLPHRPDDGRAFSDIHRARTLDYPWLLSLLACFHFGLHREHHRYPHVPWWRLPSVR